MRKNRRIISVTLLIMISLVITFFTGCQNKAEDGNVTGADVTYKELEVGDTAPDFDVELLNGETAALSDYQGKIVLLNFWATWCAPCVAEMPDIQAVADAFPDDVVVLAVNCSEKRDTVNSFIEDKGYNFNIGLDETQEITQKYPTDGIPYTVVINGDGIITSIHLGGGKGMFSVFDEDIKAILNQ